VQRFVLPVAAADLPQRLMDNAGDITVEARNGLGLDGRDRAVEVLPDAYIQQHQVHLGAGAAALGVHLEGGQASDQHFVSVEALAQADLLRGVQWRLHA